MPALKLKITTNGTTPLSADSPSASTPKLTLKINKPGTSTPTTPSATTGKGSKRTSTPSSKILANATIQAPAAPGSSAKKRKAPTGGLANAGGDGSHQPKIKRVKIVAKKNSKVPGTPLIKTKMKGKPPPRPLGVGYDSEGEDIEVDPLIEKGFILRMEPGPDCEYLREAIQNGTIGVPRNKGGADVWMKFFNANGKRGVVCVRQNLYAATMVDLPCIIEGMKSWDKKAWFKTIDICQMLLVLGRVKTEAEAKDTPLPPSVNVHTNAFAHGLTAPMHNVRRRRFRKRISTRTIEAVEEEVERLLELDRGCDKGGSKYEIVDPYATRLSDEEGSDEEEEEEEEDDEEGEEVEVELEPQDYFGNGAVDEEDHDPDDLEALLQQEMLGAGAGAGTALTIDTTELANGASALPAVISAISATADTPSVIATTPGAAGDEEESDEDEDEDDDEEEEEDEELMAANKERQAQREEIANLEAMIKSAETNYRNAPDNQLIRNKIENQIRNLRRDLELKKGALGEEDD